MKLLGGKCRVYFFSRLVCILYWVSFSDTQTTMLRVSCTVGKWCFGLVANTSYKFLINIWWRNTNSIRQTSHKLLLDLLVGHLQQLFGYYLFKLHILTCITSKKKLWINWKGKLNHENEEYRWCLCVDINISLHKHEEIIKFVQLVHWTDHFNGISRSSTWHLDKITYCTSDVDRNFVFQMDTRLW